MGNNVVLPDRQSFETMEQVRLDATVQTILQQWNVNFKDNVTSVADLPATGNTLDDFRMTIDTWFVYKWNWSAWWIVIVPWGWGWGWNKTLADVSVNSTDTTKSTYTMDDAVAVTFEDASANTMLGLDVVNGHQLNWDYSGTQNYSLKSSGNLYAGTLGMGILGENTANQYWGVGVIDSTSFGTTYGANSPSMVYIHDKTAPTDAIATLVLGEDGTGTDVKADITTQHAGGDKQTYTASKGASVMRSSPDGDTTRYGIKTLSSGSVIAWDIDGTGNGTLITVDDINWNIIGAWDLTLSNYGGGTVSWTLAYTLWVDATGNVIEYTAVWWASWNNTNIQYNNSWAFWWSDDFIFNNSTKKFQVASGGNVTAVIDPANWNYGIWDIDWIGNSTRMYIWDNIKAASIITWWDRIRLDLDGTAFTAKLWDSNSIGNDTLLTVDDVNYTINLAATDWLQTNNLFVNNLSVWFNVFDLVAADSTVFSAIPTQANITTTDFSSQDQAIISTNGSGAAFIQWVNWSTFSSWSVFATKTKAELRFDNWLPLTTWIIANTTNVRIGNYDWSGNSTIITITDSTERITVNKPFGLQWYTVATLPTWFTWATAYVTDALTPAFGATVVWGWAVVMKVWYNGANRIVW